jgi:hypothetical protein
MINPESWGVVTTRQKMTEFIENKIKNDTSKGIYCTTFTKREMYEGIGMTKPTEQFNRAWQYLTTSRAEFMSYDKELKAWVWL